MKPVAYLLDRTLAVHALVLAMRTVMARKSAVDRERHKGEKQMRLDLGAK